MKRRFNLSVLWLYLGISAFCSSAHGRRLPEPGGQATIFIAPNKESSFIEAHLSIPLLEANTPSKTASQTYYSASSWRSSFIESIEESNNNQSWSITPKLEQAATIRMSIHQCFSHTTSGKARWPAKILHLLDIKSQIKLTTGGVKITFSSPVGPLPELLAGCEIRAGKESLQGPFTLSGKRVLRSNRKSFVAAPLLDTVTLTSSTQDAHINQSRSTTISGNILVAPIPDVLLLFQSSNAVQLDPIKLSQPTGTTDFYKYLNIPLLLSISEETYGRRAETILPPGIAPPLPLAKHHPSISPLLNLPPLRTNAPVYTLQSDLGQPLLQNTGDRLRVIFRNHGIRLAQSGANPGDLQLVQWHSPTSDPGLAILHLANLYNRKFGYTPKEITKELQRKLLSPNLEERLEAALKAQRDLLRSKVILPLATLATWYEVHPDLVNIRMSPQGIPLLHDAFWSRQP